MNRFFRPAAAALAALLTAGALPAFAQADSTPPQLQDVIVGASSATAPGSVSVAVKATDDLSGIKQATVLFENRENGRILSAALLPGDYDTSAGLYRKELAIPAGEPAGTYELKSVTLIDEAKNLQTYSARGRISAANDNLPLGLATRFTVTPSQKAAKTPRITGIALDRAEAAGGATVNVTVTTDSDAAVGRILLTFANRADDRELTLALHQGDRVGPGVYRAGLEIGGFEAGGTFALTKATVIDGAKQQQKYLTQQEIVDDGKWTYRPLPQEPSFRIKNSAPDTAAPALTGVWVDRTSAAAGTSVTVWAAADDDRSGVKQLSVRFRNEQNGRVLYASMLADKSYDPATGRYRAVIEIPQYEPAGDYQIYRVTVTDEAGNRSQYCPWRERNDHADGFELLPEEPAFSVSNTPSKADADAPELEDIGYSAAGADAGRTLGVSVKAYDAGSGVRRIHLRFRNEENGRTLSLTLTARDYNPATGAYEGAILVPDNERTGYFDLVSARLTDNAGNSQSYAARDLIDSSDESEERLKLPDTGFSVSGRD